MPERVQFIEYRGKTIVYVDYSELRGEDFFRLIEEHERESLKFVQKETLHLLNFTNCRMDTVAKERADRLIRTLEANGYSAKTACFGMQGIQRIIASAVKRDIYFAKSPEEAKEWLIA